MSKPTGKLAFAYRTIAILEAKVADLEAALATQPAVRGAEHVAPRLVLPTPEQVMHVVMRFQWEDRKNGTGTTNWAANLGMAVVEYVARLNKIPPAAAHGGGLHFKTVEDLATAICQVSAYEDLGPELIAEEMFKQAGAAEAAMRAQGDSHD